MFCKMIFSNKFGFILETVFSYKTIIIDTPILDKGLRVKLHFYRYLKQNVIVWQVSRGTAATYQPGKLGTYTATALKNYRYFYTKDEGKALTKYIYLIERDTWTSMKPQSVGERKGGEKERRKVEKERKKNVGEREERKRKRE